VVAVWLFLVTLTGMYRLEAARLAIARILAHRPYRLAIQAGCGMLFLTSSFSAPAAWDRLNLLKDAGQTPIFSAVMFTVVTQSTQGGTVFFVGQLWAGSVLGGTLGLISLYITYAANGYSMEQTVTKAVVMTVCMAVWTFSMGVARFSTDNWAFLFTAAGFCMPLVALNAYYLTYVEYKALFYMWVLVALTAGAALTATLAVLPSMAGDIVESATCRTSRLLASARMAGRLLVSCL
jgi:hypothetical protein